MAEQKPRFPTSITIVLILCICLGLPWGIGYFRTNADKALFRGGRAKVCGGEYGEGIQLLQQYVEKHPDGKFASRASFFIGKAWMGLGQFESARDAFAHTASKYASTKEAHKSKYKLAMIALFEGRRGDAIAKFQKITHRPDGPLAPEADAFLYYLQMNPEGYK